MESKAKLLGHPIHPMLVTFPLALLATSLAFDAVGMVTQNGQWFEFAFWLICAGLLLGLAAATFGAVDWWAIPKATRAKRVGLYHAITNAIVMVCFGISFVIRLGNFGIHPGGFAIFLSICGVILALLGGWFGGELVDRLGVGVDDEANLNATSSLRRREARRRVEA